MAQEHMAFVRQSQMVLNQLLLHQQANQADPEDHLKRDGTKGTTAAPNSEMMEKLYKN